MTKLPIKREIPIVPETGYKQSAVSPHIYFYTGEYLERSARSALGHNLCGLSTVGWYFWDETEAYAHGPYDTEQEALGKLNLYGDELNKPPAEQRPERMVLMTRKTRNVIGNILTGMTLFMLFANAFASITVAMMVIIFPKHVIFTVHPHLIGAMLVVGGACSFFEGCRELP